MRKKILVVDNNQFFLEIIKKTLEPQGYDVFAFNDPLQALEAIKKESFDYILVDHIMPKISGARMCDYFKLDPGLKQTPIIVLTGVAIEASSRVREINADAYIAKSPIPSFISDLIGVLNHYEEGKDPALLKEKVIGVDKIYPREMTKEFLEIENHLSQILYTMSEGIIECNDEYKIFFVNRAALDFLNKTDKELIGENFFKALGISKNDEIRSFFPTPSYIRAHDTFSNEFCAPFGDKVFSVYVNALKTSTLEHGVLVVMENITELSSKISALSTVNNFAKILISELELEDVVKNMVSGFKEFIAPDTAVLLLFKETEVSDLIVKEVAGINQKLVPGDVFSSDFLLSRCGGSDSAPLLIQNQKQIEKQLKFFIEGMGYTPSSALVQAVKIQNRCLGVMVFMKKTGSFRPFSRELFESLINFSSIALENAMRYRKLRDLNIWRQNYMANISHELRTPLTIVKGFNEILCGDMIKDESSKKAVLGNMLNEVNKLARLIDNLLTISKFENIPTILKIKHSRVDVHGIINESIQDLTTEAAAKKVSFHTKFHEQNIYLNGDKELLTQSIYHLLSNALKYSHPESRVEVSTSLSGSLAYINIKDRGPGIPVEYIPQIFEKFYMVDAGPEKSTRGAGIGLYLVREILNLHYGNIQVDSTPGEGTRVTIKLPVFLADFLK